MTSLIQTYLTNPRKPAFVLPPNACDAHCHIFGPASQFPYVKERSWTPVDAGKEALFALHDSLGIQRCVIVQTALHGFDNSVVVDAMQARKGAYLGVALASAKTTSAQIAEMDQQGFRAIRFNFMAHLKNSDSIEDILELTKRMEPFGWHLQVHFSSDLVHSLAPLLKKSAVPVMVDHVGRVDASLGANHADFQGLLKLLDDPHFYVKVSGVDRISKMHPYEDGISLAKILVDEFTDRCVWGTDWPHPNHHHIPDDGNLVDLIPRIADTTEKVSKLMVSNPGKFYRFE
ncbi:amidohydrolase [Polynucleobacter sp. MWH-Aus1W21]|uniref:amidohydrolase family protein n=1 Tax=Polynucleobacter sp. MWH-Aus1W21 TaxID=1855880 RepID=UPI001BFDA1DC|nr:amidohydrolase family protein [Polynucleobacter sp. MWH-Aus1W21]QWD66704.1 amidohydrolase family protein [Polynucleobacter sp. MWH-Aus1W21]